MCMTSVKASSCKKVIKVFCHNRLSVNSASINCIIPALVNLCKLA